MKLSENDHNLLEQIISRQATLTHKQAVMDNLMRLGLSPYNILEMRLSQPEQGDPFKLAQRCADAFLSAFDIYPTSLAAHSTIAALFEASEHVITAKHRGGETVMIQMCGQGIELVPLRIEIDDSLDTRTIAARWHMSKEDAADSAKEALMRYLGAKDYPV